MQSGSKTLMLVFPFMALMLMDVPFRVPAAIDFVGEAAAVIGRPLTPLSYAGVARRTTRRAVAYTASATTAASSASTAAAPPPPAPAQPAGAPPVGTVVTTLPPGCVSSPRGGIEYFDCAGVFYRPVIQGNNLVYVIQKPG